MGQDVEHGRILVTHIEVDALGLDRPGGDQRALEHLMRTAFKIEAVLERSGLPLVAVDGHKARALIGSNYLPFAPRREPRAAQATQSGIGHLLDDLIEAEFTGAAALEDRIAALGAIGNKILVRRDLWLMPAALERCLDAFRSRVIDVKMTYFADWRGVATAHAGRAQHTNLVRADGGF